MNRLLVLDFPLRITESAGLARTREAVRCGVPLPRGLVQQPEQLRLEDAAGNAMPMQARVLSRWSDGSAQWVLIDTLAAIAGGGELELRLKQGTALQASPAMQVSMAADAVMVDTGAARFHLPGAGSCLVDSVLVRGREQLGPGGLCILFEDGRRRAHQPRINGIQVEENGALRATVRVDGVIAGTGRRRPLEFQARLQFTAGATLLDVELRIRNPRRARHPGGLWDLGDPGSQLIRELTLALTPASAPAQVRWMPMPGQATRTVPVSSAPVLYQDSSGGDAWQSPNHLAADGQLAVTFRGYQLRDANGAVLASGDRATPCVELDCAEGAVASSVEGFWQNFPKALRFAQGRLQLALFPRETRQPVELQGGEQKRHRAWFAFGGAGEASITISHCQQPLRVVLDPAAVEATRALHGFVAPHADDDPRYLAYMNTIVEGPHSFFAGREAIDEYGWRNYGDVYADHEAVHHKGPAPFISHYNNQYDVILGTLLQGLRSGAAPWFELARNLARHVADIDIYHTRDDKPAYNGGLFWHSDHYLPAGLATHRTYSRINAKGSYGGGPDNEQNYTSGLLAWHFLTGDQDAAEAVRSLADFVVAMDDGKRTLLRFVDRSPTGNASKTVSSDFHGPGRGAGNSINALLDAYWLTRERGYLLKATDLVRRCVHPQDDIAAIGLDEPEYRWSYLVFLQVLAKYLALKKEMKEQDDDFHYARDSLLHYAKWMLANERPYAEQLQKVLLPTETWPAQDVRKARVLEAAARHCGEGALQRALHLKGAEFMDRCLTDLLRFQTAHLVRPRVLLAVYGGRLCLPGEHIAQATPAAGRVHAPRSHFVSQKMRIKRMLRGQLWRARNP
jgi:hypothetical protein